MVTVQCKEGLIEVKYKIQKICVENLQFPGEILAV